MRMTIGQIAEVTGGRLYDAGGDLPVADVSTDSRTVQPGEVFVALQGERFDGHSFVAPAIAAGTVAAIVSKEPGEVPPGSPLIRVQDTLRAYGQLAAWVRGHFDTTIIGVTGSAGKTTTKDMIGSILRLAGPTLVTPRTENNEIGVPRTLLALNERHRYCVLEMAMRGRQQIQYLVQVAAPQIGVITNIGKTHLGLLGSVDAIAQAKAELLGSLPTQGTAVLNADDFYFPVLKEMAPCRVISFGVNAEAQVRVTDVKLRGLDGSECTLWLGSEALAISLVLPGRHNILNAAAAAAAAWAASDSTQHTAEGLANCAPTQMRCERHFTAEGAVIINDAYNASPTSVEAALEWLGELDRRKIFVFGDMLEIGESSEDEHRCIGRLCAEQGIDWLVALGRWAPLAAEAAEQRAVRADVVDSPQAAVELIRGELTATDAVLVKASRKIGLEAVVEGLRDDG